MGYYLEMNHRETNSKTYSTILVEAIRYLDSVIMNCEQSTRKERKYFVPEYYNKDNIGCGDWIIRKKGIIMLVTYLRHMLEDDSLVREIGVSENEDYISNLTDKKEKEEVIEKFTKEAKEDILWCLLYVIDVLTDMCTYRLKKIKAHWV